MTWRRARSSRVDLRSDLRSTRDGLRQKNDPFKEFEEQLISGAFVESSNAAQSLEVSTEVPPVGRGFDPLRLARIESNRRTPPGTAPDGGAVD